MKILNGIFWIVAISFLLAGQSGGAHRFDQGPAADLFGPEAPAVQSSELVVDRVSEIKGVCKREEEVCGIVGAVAYFSLRLIDQVLSQFFDKKSLQEARRAKSP